MLSKIKWTLKFISIFDEIYTENIYLNYKTIFSVIIIPNLWVVFLSVKNLKLAKMANVCLHAEQMEYFINLVWSSYRKA